MKTILLLIALSPIFNAFSIEVDSIPVEQVERYDEDPFYALRIPAQFGEPLLITPKVADLIAGQRIQHVSLVYTQNKQNVSFDQKGLNAQRIEEITALLPQITQSNPTWSFVEQTGAANPKEAASYFHGFVLYFGSMTDYSELKSFFKDYQQPFETFTVDNAVGANIQLESGTRLHIPANAVSIDGQNVAGNYTLNYRDYRDQTDILFSGIPMEYTEDEEAYLFDSYGMFEIRGEQNGQDLTLEKNISVDFNCTDTASGVDYYALDETTETWEKLQPIDFKDTECHTKPETPDWYWRGRKKDDHALLFVMHGKLDEVLDTISKDPTLREIEYTVDREKQALVMSPMHLDIFLDFMDACVYPDKVVEVDMETSNQFPALIPGLTARSFGVFNCDKMFQEKNPVIVAPYYVDAATGEEITCPRTASVINKRLNTASSYHPNRFRLDTESKNAILLFTNDGKIYACKDTKNVSILSRELGQTSFEMTEITADVHSAEDVKKILHL